MAMAWCSQKLGVRARDCRRNDRRTTVLPGDPEVWLAPPGAHSAVRKAVRRRREPTYRTAYASGHAQRALRRSYKVRYVAGGRAPTAFRTTKGSAGLAEEEGESEAEDRGQADGRPAALHGLREHRVREHREDGAAGEGLDQPDRVRRGVAEDGVPEGGGERRHQRHAGPEAQDPARRVARLLQARSGRQRL